MTQTNRIVRRSGPCQYCNRITTQVWTQTFNYGGEVMMELKDCSDCGRSLNY